MEYIEKEQESWDRRRLATEAELAGIILQIPICLGIGIACSTTHLNLSWQFVLWQIYRDPVRFAPEADIQVHFGLPLASVFVQHKTELF